MKNILLIISISIFSFGIFSCGTTEKKAETIEGADLLYEKYKNMVTEGEGCEVCIDCASLALAITYDTQDEADASRKILIDYYNENGTIPCPELLPELKKEIALVADTE